VNVAAEEAPPAVVTTRFFAPAVPAGLTIVRVVSSTTVTDEAALPSIVTPVTLDELPPPKKPVPVRVIVVDPAVGPETGLTNVTVGTGA
jgi:hypothetical protein